MFALQVDYKRASDRHTSAYVAPRHSHDGKFSVSLCAGHGLGVATRKESEDEDEEQGEEGDVVDAAGE